MTTYAIRRSIGNIASAASLAYDQTMHDWIIGTTDADGGIYAGHIPNPHATTGVGTRIMRLKGVTAGNYRFKQMTFRHALWGQSRCDGFWVVVYKTTGYIATLVMSEDHTADIPAVEDGSAPYTTATLTLDMNLAHDGGNYWIGVAFRSVAGAPVGYNGMRCVANSTISGCTSNWATTATAPPASYDITANLLSNPAHMWMGTITFETRNKLVQTMTGADIAKGENPLIARCQTADRPTHVILNGLVTANAATDTFNIGNIAADGTMNTLAEGTRKENVAGSAASQMTYNRTTTSEANQAGHSMDLLICLDLDDGSGNLFWKNTTVGQGLVGPGPVYLDIETHCHTAVDTGNHGTAYSAHQEPQYISLTSSSASLTLSSIHIGIETMVLLGDSQIIQMNYNNVYRDAFTYPHPIWSAGIGGNCLTQAGSTAQGLYHTPTPYRYKSLTPGHGDICDMRGIYTVMLSPGVNDISVLATTEANGTKALPDMLASIGYIAFYTLAGQHNRFIAMSIVPWYAVSPSGASANAAKWATSQSWGRMLTTFLISLKAPMYDPWDKVMNNPAILDSGQLHINRAGSEVVPGITGNVILSAIAVRLIESNQIYRRWPGDVR